MSPSERLDLLGEKTELERMLEETPVEDVLDRASLEARLASVEDLLREAGSGEREPAGVDPSFRGNG